MNTKLKSTKDGSKTHHASHPKKPNLAPGRSRPGRVSIQILDHTGKQYCWVEFSKAMFDRIQKVMDAANWTLEEFFTAAVRSKVVAAKLKALEEGVQRESC